MSITNKLLLLVFVIVVLFLESKAVKKTEQSFKVKPTSKVNQSEDSLNTQENEGGNVTISVKPKVLKIGEKPVFEIVFDTHSVELDFDIARQTILVDDKGNIFDQPVWDGSPPGGHHRSGNLTFDTLLRETSSIELIIKDISGVEERRFKWNLKGGE